MIQSKFERELNEQLQQSSAARSSHSIHDTLKQKKTFHQQPKKLSEVTDACNHPEINKLHTTDASVLTRLQVNASGEQTLTPMTRPSPQGGRDSAASSGSRSVGRSRRDEGAKDSSSGSSSSSSRRRDKEARRSASSSRCINYSSDEQG